MPKRLTNKYKEGRGDSGYSWLNAVDGVISKGSFYPIFFSLLDFLQHDLSEYIKKEKFNEDTIEKQDLEFFHYLLQLSFSINAFIFSVGEDDPSHTTPNWCEKQLPKEDAFNFIEKRIEELKNKCESDFNLTDHEFIIPGGNLNLLRLRVRQLEQALWAVRDQRREVFIKLVSENMVKVDRFENSSKYDPILALSTWQTANSRFKVLGGFLNRLSSYFFHLMKYSLLKNTSEGNLEEWRSVAPTLSDFIVEEE